MNEAGPLWFLDWCGWMCHQLPARSPQFGTNQFPVCYRCAGIHLGLAISYFTLVMAGLWRARFPSVKMALVLSAMIFPLMPDGLANVFGWWQTPACGRALTGLGLGLALPWLLAPLASDTDGHARARPKHLFFASSFGLTSLLLLVNLKHEFTFLALALIAATGWTFFLGHLAFAVGRSYLWPRTTPTAPQSKEACS